MTAPTSLSEFMKTLTLLYVEDDVPTLEATAVFLRRRVGRVVTAPDGQAGLEAFRSAPPDLVLTDLQMPRLDGLAMAEAIRALAPEAPILVTTAFEQTEYLTRSIELGIDQYILKPIQTRQLDTALERCARRLWAEDQARQKVKLEAELLQLRHQASVQTLLGGLGHDYNNLLQALFAGHDLARMLAEPGSQVLEALDTVRASADQARKLSKWLFILTRAGAPPKGVGPVLDLVREAVKSALAGGAVTPEWDCPDGNPPLRHDPQSLQQAVAQLVANAREAMPGGGVLRVALRRESRVDPVGREGGGDWVRLTFRDEGKGIAPEHLPRIFEPYFTTKERGRQKGVGLGLALCEAVIRSHGGFIEVETRLGAGSAFHVFLPAVTSGPTPGTAER